MRGFRLGGLGPHDGTDAVGGDVYAAGSFNLLMPIPRVGADRPLRFQAFINGGRSLALRNYDNTSSSPPSSKSNPQDTSISSPSSDSSVLSNLLSTVKHLTDSGLPSTAAGIGLVYAHPAARFELNFTLPLVLRRGEDARKGLQVGVGVYML